MPELNSKEVVITLYEHHYHFGVAALINSLVNSKFDGLVLIGYRGDLPLWTSQLTTSDTGQGYLVGSVRVKFERIDTRMHFGYYKPTFIDHVFNTYPSADQVYYFDPDIVINAPWKFFHDWAEAGIALCLDLSFPYVHENHPWRNEWKKMAGADGRYFNPIDYYVNSGFIGIKRSDRLLIERWIDLTRKYDALKGDLTLFEKDGFRSFKGDQDLLNAAITVSSDLVFSIIGKEGMGFVQPAYLMTHAIDSIKPWKKKFVRQLILSGKKPNLFEKNYFRYCNSPIRVYTKSQMKLKRFDLQLSAALGRFIGKDN
ncbi:MAG TPA: hypothetical protein VGC08_03025 [Pedobacter sp.]